MRFPPGFLFGTANADHQVEAHDPSCEDVWDVWERCQGLTPRGKATDFSNRYEQDIAHAAAMGCRVFRFSVAWARIEPRRGHYDDAQLQHYRRVAECIRSHDMKVMLTLHHFVWPVWLERDWGGMLAETFPDFFASYAQQVATSLGDIVDFWITFNEPSQLTFGFIKPWWQNRYYMPPGLPRGSNVDAEAHAVGKLIPNLFLAHARARQAIRALRADAPVGANPLVTGFPPWLQAIMDWGACHRRLSEALFKFTSRDAFFSHKKVDLVIGGLTASDQTRYAQSDPYLTTGKAILVRSDFSSQDEAEPLRGKVVGVVAIGNQPQAWGRDLPSSATKKVFTNYCQAHEALAQGKVDALYGDGHYLTSPTTDLTKDNFRWLHKDLSHESYVVAMPHGHTDWMDRINQAVANFQQKWLEKGNIFYSPTSRPAPRPLSLSEVLHPQLKHARQAARRSLRKLQRRGFIHIGIRLDAPVEHATEHGADYQLARCIAKELLGDESKMKISLIAPSQRLKVLDGRSSWLNWLWRFWGTTCLIANANWWYLGTSGRLPKELCPEEAIGAQDFIGLDYYWGLPTSKLHRYRSLEDAAHGRFTQAPVWPEGLYHALCRFHRWFPGQHLFIVENGSVPIAGGISRSDYLVAHLAQVRRAIARNIPVIGYNYWSITSNREWGHAFDPNTDFGLYFVDLDRDPALQRIASKEVALYQKIIAEEMLELSPKA